MAKRRSFLPTALILGAVLLLIASVVVTAVGITAIGNLRRDAAELAGQRDARKQGYADAEAGMQARFKAADLAAKLARVKELDKATDEAYRRWNDVTGTTLGSLMDAMQACNDAVILYDQSVAPFPPAMLDGLPEKVNLANPETDCGRAFTKDI